MTSLNSNSTISESNPATSNPALHSTPTKDSLNNNNSNSSNSGNPNSLVSMLKAAPPGVIPQKNGSNDTKNLAQATPKTEATTQLKAPPSPSENTNTSNDKSVLNNVQIPPGSAKAESTSTSSVTNQAPTITTELKAPPPPPPPADNINKPTSILKKPPPPSPSSNSASNSAISNQYPALSVTASTTEQATNQTTATASTTALPDYSNTYDYDLIREQPHLLELLCDLFPIFQMLWPSVFYDVHPTVPGAAPDLPALILLQFLWDVEIHAMDDLVLFCEDPATGNQNDDESWESMWRGLDCWTCPQEADRFQALFRFATAFGGDELEHLVQEGLHQGLSTDVLWLYLHDKLQQLVVVNPTKTVAGRMQQQQQQQQALQQQQQQQYSLMQQQQQQRQQYPLQQPMQQYPLMQQLQQQQPAPAMIGLQDTDVNTIAHDLLEIQAYWDQGVEPPFDYIFTKNYHPGLNNDDMYSNISPTSVVATGQGSLPSINACKNTAPVNDKNYDSDDGGGKIGAVRDLQKIATNTNNGISSDVDTPVKKKPRNNSASSISRIYY